MQNNFDAIIVLGHGQKNREINPILKNRLDKAVEIFESNREAKIILSGGKNHSKEFSEAELMADYLENKAVKRENLILEDKSKNTFENFVFSKKIIEQYGFKNIALVTSDYHIKRVQMIAKKMSLDVLSFPAFSSKDKKFKIIELTKEFFKTIFDFVRISIVKNTKLIIKDKYLRVIFAINAAILLVVFALIYSNFIGIKSPIIIHFDAYKGIDFLGTRIDIFGIFLSALVIFVINLFFANYLFYRERFLSYLFASTTLFLMILFLIAVAAIISVN